MTLESNNLAAILITIAVARGGSAAEIRPAKSYAVERSEGVQLSSEVPLWERPARTGANLDSPVDLHEIKIIVEDCFRVELAIEPLREQCAGSDPLAVPLEAFSIVEGEQFGEVITRLTVASGGRWVFQQIHDVPLLRPDRTVDGHGTLLDTVISVEIDASSMWEALCTLALAVNRATDGQSDKGRPLIVRFLSPTLMRLPPPLFLEEKAIRVSLKAQTAREGLCAIFAQVAENIRYSYTCVAEGFAPSYDYIDISAYDADGKVIDGGRLPRERIGILADTEDWMSDERTRAVQIPAHGKAAN